MADPNTNRNATDELKALNEKFDSDYYDTSLKKYGKRVSLVLPQAYDDSLTFYEALNKLMITLNGEIGRAQSAEYLNAGQMDAVYKALNENKDFHLTQQAVTEVTLDASDPDYFVFSFTRVDGTVVEVGRIAKNPDNPVVELKDSITEFNAANYETHVLHETVVDGTENDVMKINIAQKQATAFQANAAGDGIVVTTADQEGTQSSQNVILAQIGRNQGNIIAVNSRINNITSQAGSDNTEIVDARFNGIENLTYGSLAARLNGDFESAMKGGDSFYSVSAKERADTTPWNDLNTLPANSIVSYSPGIYSEVQNIPTDLPSGDQGLLVLTFTGLHLSSSDIGVMQILTPMAAGSSAISKVYIRGNWTEKWSAWRALYDQSLVTSINRTISEVTSARKSSTTGVTYSSLNARLYDDYKTCLKGGNSYYYVDTAEKAADYPWDDLDTMPINSIVGYDAPAHGSVQNLPADLPSGDQGLIVLTFNGYSFGSTGSAIFQVLIPMDSHSSVITKIFFRGNWDDAWSEWKFLYDGEKNVSSEINYNALSLFASVSFLGDGYTKGSLYSDAGLTDSLTEQSYPKILARKTGISPVVYAGNDESTVGWITNHLAELLAAEPTQAYTIFLGINDIVQNREIGETADINIGENYDANKDNFYGQYSRIIANIKSHAPDAMILLITIPENCPYGTETQRTNFNAAIQELGKTCGCPVIDVNKTDQVKALAGKYKGSHPTAAGYAVLSAAIESGANLAINEF